MVDRMKKRQFVSFDWALKKLLRSKANFVILEGFLSELLKEDIKIVEVLESEANKNSASDKMNRVDLLVKNQKEELIIVELQYEYEVDYIQRILYGTAKAITDNINEGMRYSNIKKVISVSILYFDLGQGEDYVYKGTARFFGVHKNDELKLSDSQKSFYATDEISKIYPEYYILKINQFNDIAKDGLDEWIYFLKNDDVKKGSTAKGLKEAASELNVMKMSQEEQNAYESYREDLIYQASMIHSHYFKGRFEGKAEGRAEGMLEVARKMKSQGFAVSAIVEISGLSLEEIDNI